MAKVRILVTGGGTGGHIYPIVSVVAELQILSVQMNMETEVKYFGAAGTYKELLETNNIEVESILSSKLRRYFSLGNFLDLPKFLLSLFQSLWKIFWFMPDVVFSKGGPGALPVVLVSWFYRIPIIIHESDAFPGLTNTISSRFAKTITLAFPAARNYFRGRNPILVGNPIRKYLLKENLDERTAKGFLEFDTEKPLLLVLGGSQGSTRINDFIVKNLDPLLQITQIFHQTGRNNYENVATATRDLPENLKLAYKIVDYFEKDLGLAMRASNLVLSRAGSGSIFEIAAFGKPAFLIPLPDAAGNHQLLNATDYASTGAALVFGEDKLSPEIFIEQLSSVINDPGKIKSMSEAALKFSRPESALNLAQIILKLVGYASQG